LKQQIKLRKFETRWSHARSRKDDKTEERARQEWKTYVEQLQKDQESIWHTHDMGLKGLTSDIESTLRIRPETTWETPGGLDRPVVRKSRDWLVAFWHILIKQVLQMENQAVCIPPPPSTDTVNGKAINEKQLQTDHAQQLLKNMTRGTQTSDMFDNDLALVGYTRQKFVERALLAAASLDRIEDAQGVDAIWKKVHQVQKVASIGCGPGCDAIGILAFLNASRQNCAYKDPPRKPLLKKIILMDYVIPQWKRLVIDSLESLIQPDWVSEISTAFCDVRFSLDDERNAAARLALQEEPVDLVVVSYLLTETRGKWHDFFGSLQHTGGGLLLMSEPTAWQLHEFLNLFRDAIQTHVWLDSSRDTPLLQGLEGRMGPAVVLVQYKDTKSV